MEVLEIVLPVLAMIILGILCRKWKLLDQSGVNNMKTLVTNIMLLFTDVWNRLGYHKAGIAWMNLQTVRM